MATSVVGINTDQYVRVNVGLNPLVLQAPRDSVHVVLSDLQPAVGNPVFHLIGGKDAPLKLDSIDTNVWALAMTDRSSLIVTETTMVPVSVDNVVETSTQDAQYHNFARQEELLTSILVELRVLNRYMSLAQDIELTENDAEA